MKRGIGMGIAAVGIVLAAWVAIVGPWPLRDVRPADDPAWAASFSRLDGVATRMPSAGAGALSAGWARASITPRVPTNTAGFGDVTARTVADSVYARAIALRSGDAEAILIGGDILIVTREISDSVRAALARDPGIAPDRILFTATHTHSGPGNWAPGWIGKKFAGEYRRSRVDSVVAAMVRAARDAHAALAPSAFACGTFAAPELIRNRLLGTDGNVDSLFVWAAFRRPDGATAVWGRFSAHATTVGERAAVITGDYPGVWARALEGSGAAFALFSAGAVGSMSARGQGSDLERARSVGTPLADSVRAGLSRAAWTAEAHLLAFSVPVELPPSQMRPQGIFSGEGWGLSRMLSRRLVPYDDTTISLLAIDRLLIAGFPCDLSGELSRELARDPESRGFVLATTSFAGDYIGYVIPDRHGHIDNYETRTMSWWGPHMGSYLGGLGARAIALAAERIGPPTHASAAGETR